MLWKAVFLLFLFVIGILIGLNINKTQMHLVQDDKGNNLVLTEMKECCSFVDFNEEVKVCKALKDYGCDECYRFCEGRKEG